MEITHEQILAKTNRIISETPIIQEEVDRFVNHNQYMPLEYIDTQLIELVNKLHAISKIKIERAWR